MCGCGCGLGKTSRVWLKACIEAGEYIAWCVGVKVCASKIDGGSVCMHWWEDRYMHGNGSLLTLHDGY